MKTATKITRIRGDTFGYLQRSFLGCVSDVDQREARDVGEKAVQYAHFGDGKGNTSGSVTIHRTGSYSVEYQLSLLEDIAGKTKVMADEFIHENGHDVTESSSLISRRSWVRTFPRSPGCGPISCRKF